MPPALLRPSSTSTLRRLALSSRYRGRPGPASAYIISARVVCDGLWRTRRQRAGIRMLVRRANLLWWGRGWLCSRALCLECYAFGTQVLEEGVGVHTSNLTIPFSSGAYKACRRAFVSGGRGYPPSFESLSSFLGGEGGCVPPISPARVHALYACTSFGLGSISRSSGRGSAGTSREGLRGLSSKSRKNPRSFAERNLREAAERSSLRSFATWITATGCASSWACRRATACTASRTLFGTVASMPSETRSDTSSLTTA